MPIRTIGRLNPTKAILYYTILYYIILYYIISYHIILYYIMLYYIIVYCIIFYYIILYYITLCACSPHRSIAARRRFGVWWFLVERSTPCERARVRVRSPRAGLVLLRWCCQFSCVSNGRGETKEEREESHAVSRTDPARTSREPR